MQPLAICPRGQNAPEMVVGQVFMLYVNVVVNGVPLKASPSFEPSTLKPYTLKP